MKWEVIEEIPKVNVNRNSQYDEFIDLTFENRKIRLSELEVDPKRFVSGLYSRCNTRGLRGKIGCRIIGTSVYIFLKED